MNSVEGNVRTNFDFFTLTLHAFSFHVQDERTSEWTYKTAHCSRTFRKKTARIERPMTNENNFFGQLNYHTVQKMASWQQAVNVRHFNQ